MRKIYLVGLVFIFIISPIIIFTSPSNRAIAQTNLLTNPGFETGDTTNWNHWCIGSTVTEAEKNSGKYSLKLECLEWTEGGLIQEISSGFVVGQTLNAGAWIKTDSGLGSAEVGIKIEFVNGSTSYVTSQYFTGINDWRQVEISTTIPSGTTQIKYLLHLKGGASGDYAWFDDNYAGEIAGGISDFYEAEDFTDQLGGAVDAKENASGDFTLGNWWGADSGDYAAYSVNIGGSEDDVFFELRYSCKDGQGNVISIYWDDVLKDSFTTISTGGWDSFMWNEVINIGPVIEGTHILKITSGGEAGIAGVNLDCFRLYSHTDTEILIDNFDDGSDPNEVGGSTGCWGENSNFYYDNTVYRGDLGYSLRLTNGAVAGDVGSYLLLNDLNIYTLACTHLVFYVKGAIGGESFKVGLKDNNFAEKKLQIDDSDYILDGTITTDWKKVVIPLEDFNNPAVDMWNLNNLSFTHTSQNNILYIDDVSFTVSPGRINYFYEAEDFTDQLGGAVDEKENASRDYTLGSWWGADSGDYAVYAMGIEESKDDIVFQVRYSGNEPGITLSVYWDDILKGSFVSLATGGENTFRWGSKINIGLIEEGTHTLKIVSGGGASLGINLDCFRLYNHTDTEILIDNFDDGSDPNEVGGSTGCWGENSNFYYDNTVYRGDLGYSLKITNGTVAGDVGVYLTLNSLNIYKNSCTHFMLYVKGASGGESFKIGLRENSFAEKKLQIDGSDYILDGTVTTDWKKVVIPLEDFNNSAVDMWDLNNLSLTHTSGNNTLYIDDVSFIHAISVPEDYATMQAAINAADRIKELMLIRVAPGTYYENVVMEDGITLKGEDAQITIIDGGGSGHVITAADNCVIEGFTLKNSGGDPLNDTERNSGVYCDSSSPKIINNIITNCKYGISLWGNSNSFIAKNVIFHNSANGIRVCDSSAPDIYNNVIVDSHTGIFSNSSAFPVTNNIIVNNSDYGIFSQVTSPTISYNDVWNNGVNYSGCSSGIGDISDDPLFVNPFDENYHLKRYLSPCIDKGIDIGFPYGGAAPDLGAFESVMAFASGTEEDHPENTPDNAIDGDPTTRWSTEWTDPQWIYIDLGANPEPYNVVVLNWEAAYGEVYEIQVSDDAVDWITVYTKNYGDGGIDRIYVGEQTARYVKMHGIKKGTEWGYSLYEFSVELHSDSVAPAAPAGLSAAVDDSIVFLNWDDNSEEDLRGYNAYRTVTAGGPYTKLNEEPFELTRYRDKTVTNGITYYYIAKAIDFSGNESIAPDEVSVMPQISNRDFFDIPSCAWQRYIGDIPANCEGTCPDRGVALGGLGAGSFMYSISGAFGPWHMKIARYGVRTDWLEAGAFHIYEKKGAQPASTSCLSTNKNIKSAWNKIKIGEGKYYALQPKGWTSYNCFSTDVSSKFFSPIIAHNYKETSYPVAVWQWKLSNPTSETVEAAVMLTWPNVDARYVCNIRTGFTGTEKLYTDVSGNIRGIVLKAVSPDNSDETENSEWCIAAKEDSSTTISYVTSWNKDGDGSDIWNDFKDNGVLSNSELDTSYSAAALAVKTTLGPGESKVIPIVISWDFPVIEFGSGTQWWRKYCEYFGRDSDNSFDTAVEALINYAGWEEKVDGWMNLFVENSAYPDWLKRAAFNELYYSQFGGCFYESGLKSGQPEEFMGLHPEDHKHFIMECQHYYNCSPLDVRHYVPVYAKFWPEIERDTLRCYADATLYYEFPFSLDPPLPEGARMVLHDVGNPQDWVDPFGTGEPYNCDPYFNFDAYRNACPNMPYWKDLHSKFIQQCWKYYYLYKDKEFLSYVWPACKAAYEFMKTTDTKSDLPGEEKDYLPDNEGSDNTYDTWGLWGTSTLCGGLWVAALETMEQIAIIENDPILDEVQTWLYGPGGSGGAKANLDEILWYEYDVGKGYYKIDTESSSPTSIMADALNGQRYCEVCGLTDILPADRMKSHLKEVYERCVVPLTDYVGKFGVGEKDGIGDVGAVNGRKEDGSSVGSIEQGEEVWAGTTYFLAALMYRAGLTEEALLSAYGAYYPVYEDESLAYWFNTPEAWQEDGKGPRPVHAPEQYMRARAVWELMFEINDPYIEEKEAIASSYIDDCTSNKAIDGNFVTRWASESSSPQWIYIDFGERKSFNTVTLNWHDDYAIAYQIQISDNASNWDVIHIETSSDGGVDTIYVGGQAARYVRIYGTQSSAGAGYSLYEFQVHSPLSCTVDYLNPRYYNGNGIPVYYIGDTVEYQLSLKNLGSQELSNLAIEAIQEYYESDTNYTKGEPLPGDSTQVWTNQTILETEELVLTDSYYIPCDVQPALDQTHVIVTQDGIELYNNPEAGIWCPPLPTAKISGQVTIQGRSNHAELITFELRDPGQTLSIKTYEILTDALGNYTLTRIPEGTFDLTAKSSNTLRAKNEAIIVVEGETTSNIDFSLLGGDCDNNNVVTGLDFSILRGAYGSVPGDANWDERADIDGNGVVTGLDFSILRGNYGTAGAD